MSNYDRQKHISTVFGITLMSNYLQANEVLFTVD